jgi:hypothetical protein
VSARAELSRFWRDHHELVRSIMEASRSTGTHRQVLYGLANYVDHETFESSPGETNLALITGRSEATVRRALRGLEEAEEIAHVAPGRRGRAAVYRLLLAPAEPRKPLTLDERLSQVVSRSHSRSHSRSKSGRKPLTLDERPTATSNLPPLNGSRGGNGNQPDPATLDLFHLMRGRLAAFVASPFIAHTMVDPLELLGRRGDVLEVLAPSHSILRIRRTYGPLLEDYARELSGERLRVHVIGEHELAGGRA